MAIGDVYVERFADDVSGLMEFWVWTKALGYGDDQLPYWMVNVLREEQTGASGIQWVGAFFTKLVSDADGSGEYIDKFDRDDWVKSGTWSSSAGRADIEKPSITYDYYLATGSPASAYIEFTPTYDNATLEFWHNLINAGDGSTWALTRTDTGAVVALNGRGANSSWYFYDSTTWRNGVPKKPIWDSNGNAIAALGSASATHIACPVEMAVGLQAGVTYRLTVTRNANGYAYIGPVWIRYHANNNDVRPDDANRRLYFPEYERYTTGANNTFEYAAIRGTFQHGVKSSSFTATRWQYDATDFHGGPAHAHERIPPTANELRIDGVAVTLASMGIGYSDPAANVLSGKIVELEWQVDIVDETESSPYSTATAWAVLTAKAVVTQSGLLMDIDAEFVRTDDGGTGGQDERSVSHHYQGQWSFKYDANAPYISGAAGENLYEWARDFGFAPSHFRFGDEDRIYLPDHVAQVLGKSPLECVAYFERIPHGSETIPDDVARVLRIQSNLSGVGNFDSNGFKKFLDRDQTKYYQDVLVSVNVEANTHIQAATRFMFASPDYVEKAAGAGPAPTRGRRMSPNFSRHPMRRNIRAASNSGGGGGEQWAGSVESVEWFKNSSNKYVSVVHVSGVLKPDGAALDPANWTIEIDNGANLLTMVVGEVYAHGKEIWLVESSHFSGGSTGASSIEYDGDDVKFLDGTLLPAFTKALANDE